MGISLLFTWISVGLESSTVKVQSPLYEAVYVKEKNRQQINKIEK